jgi:hypothetical protein
MMPKRGSVLGDVKDIIGPEAKEEPEKVAEENGPAKPKASNPIDMFQVFMNNVDAVLANPTSEDVGLDKEFSPYAEAWTWILRRFHTVKNIRKIIIDYWTDSGFSSEQRKQVLLLALEGKIEDEGLMASLGRDICIQGEIRAFKWMNPASFELESHCLGIGKCPGTFEATIVKKLGPAVDVKTSTGDIFGFMVPRPKDNILVFKSLDRIKSKRVIGAVGSDCSIASDLGGHRERVRGIQDLIRAAEPSLGALLMNDEKRGKKKKGDVEGIMHIDDFSHNYICLYMEFLLRLMDSNKMEGKRWFLNGVEAARAGLKGR